MDNWIIDESDKYFSELEKHVDNWKPEISIENDGIGWYEYGSIRAFDNGNSYPVINEDAITVHYVGFDVPVSQRYIKKVVNDLYRTMEELNSNVQVIDDNGKKHTVKWKVVSISDGINSVRFKIEFGDVE